ncbi:unnamed protein product [Meloidogyne enterolobii]|uniref:Uncharacterized protein n=1 Tax=Meloidogyne enterolobii TaxID=390850 RepID=A0ACB0ZU60_MELEN
MERWNAAFKQSTSSQPDHPTTSTTSTSHQTRQQSVGLLRMPSFAGTQPSRHGRQRKLTKRVVQMLNESMPKPPEHGPALIRQQQEKIRRRQRRGGGGKDDNVEEEGGGGEVADEDEGDESFDEADEEGEEETDDRAWCYCKQVCVKIFWLGISCPIWAVKLSLKFLKINWLTKINMNNL